MAVVASAGLAVAMTTVMVGVKVRAEIVQATLTVAAALVVVVMVAVVVAEVMAVVIMVTVALYLPPQPLSLPPSLCLPPPCQCPFLLQHLVLLTLLPGLLGMSVTVPGEAVVGPSHAAVAKAMFVRQHRLFHLPPQLLVMLVMPMVLVQKTPSWKTPRTRWSPCGQR